MKNELAINRAYRRQIRAERDQYAYKPSPAALKQYVPYKRVPEYGENQPPQTDRPVKPLPPPSRISILNEQALKDLRKIL